VPGRTVVVLVLAALGCGGPLLSSGPSPSPNAPGWTLVWSDEFDGAAGALVDATKWVFDLGGNGWGNYELEYYTDRARNASLTGEGTLAIQAFRESYRGADGVSRDFTSARLKTLRRFEQAYGRFEARLKVPRGQGLWPAFWMLGADIETVDWPACGEIDVMENIGREPSTIHGTMHGPGYSGAGGLSGSYALPAGARFTDDFHVFAVEWEPAAVRWYVDGALYHTRTPADLPAGTRWVFDHPFFILLNVAVGGDWPGSPDASTAFPQTMLVDFVRAYRKG
jgi:beta-glucanase (GH16 family)